MVYSEKNILIWAIPDLLPQPPDNTRNFVPVYTPPSHIIPFQDLVDTDILCQKSKYQIILTLRPKDSPFSCSLYTPCCEFTPSHNLCTYGFTHFLAVSQNRCAAKVVLPIGNRNLPVSCPASGRFFFLGSVENVCSVEELDFYWFFYPAGDYMFCTIIYSNINVCASKPSPGRK